MYLNVVSGGKLVLFVAEVERIEPLKERKVETKVDRSTAPNGLGQSIYRHNINKTMEHII